MAFTSSWKRQSYPVEAASFEVPFPSSGEVVLTVGLLMTALPQTASSPEIQDYQLLLILGASCIVLLFEFFEWRVGPCGLRLNLG